MYQTEDNQWVILDYKTSRVIAPQGLSQSYGIKSINGIASPEGARQSQSYGIASSASGHPRNDDIERYAKRYEAQMMLYALACYELLKVEVRAARLYFVRGGQSFDFTLRSEDFQTLRSRFESVQKEIIGKRKSWLSSPK